MELGLVFITCDVQLFIATAGFRLFKMRYLPEGEGGKKKKGGRGAGEKKRMSFIV